MQEHFLDSTWFTSALAVFSATMLSVLIVFELGLRIGRWRSRRPDPEPQLPARVLVSSTLSLLAFILGFTFGLASQHFDSRSQSAFDEAISIATAYHRTDLLSDPERRTVRQLMRKYVDLRLEINRSGEIETAIPELRRLQEQIWTEAMAAAKKGSSSLSAAPLLQSLTEIFDTYGERVLAGFKARIPARIWVLLSMIMAVSVAAAGYLAGLAGARRSLASLGYAAVLALVMLMIVAGDTPGSSQIKSNREVFLDLQGRMPAP